MGVSGVDSIEECESYHAIIYLFFVSFLSSPDSGLKILAHLDEYRILSRRVLISPTLSGQGRSICTCQCEGYR